MRIFAFLAASASVAALAMPAAAATYVFNSGIFVPGVTAPDPLMSPDVLELNTSSNKTWVSPGFTNQSGTVKWNAGNLYLNNAAIVNNNLWDASDDYGIYHSGGTTSFTNNGTFRKSGGFGNTTIDNNNFINNGIIDAQTGTILFNGNGTTFNSGSSFTGAGVVNIAQNAAFNGAMNSQNLLFSNGTFTGNAAQLNGVAGFTAGTFAGTWEVASGATLSSTGSSNRFLAGSFTNNGTFDWQGGNLYLTSASVVNNGLWEDSGDNGIYHSGGTTSFTNNGTFRKNGGSGNTTIGNNNFINNGIIDAQTGTILFIGNGTTFNSGSVFTGSGVVNIANNATFNGAMNSQNLLFSNGTYTGNAAQLNGVASFTAGTFAGTWEVASGATLSSTGSSNRYLAGSFTNNGTFDWQGGNLYLTSASVVNNGLWEDSGDNGIYHSGGTTSFTNNGTFRKNGGSGNTTIGNNNFINNGIIDAQTGTILFIGNGTTFNGGSVFTGSGVVNIANNATFNDDFNSQNLLFSNGTYTGNAAQLNGVAGFTAGTFAGTWEVASGATLSSTGSSNRFLAGSFTNNGTFDWQGGNLYLTSASVVNNGLWEASDDNGIYHASGTNSFINNGMFLKSGGFGNTTIANNVPFQNHGVMNVLSGTIALPTNFANDGTIAGTGSYYLSGILTNNGTIAPGDIGAAGTLSLLGNYSQSAAGTLASQLASSLAWDLFNISGTASLGGTLAISCILSCNISNGDTFVLLDSDGTLTGTFANVTTSGFLNGFAYDVLYDYQAGRVLLSVLDVGQQPPGPGPGVPEPATWALLIAGFGLVGAAARRRRILGRTAH